jgi:hypothetical protein
VRIGSGARTKWKCLYQIHGAHADHGVWTGGLISLEAKWLSLDGSTCTIFVGIDTADRPWEVKPLNILYNTMMNNLTISQGGQLTWMQTVPEARVEGDYQPWRR